MQNELATVLNNRLGPLPFVEMQAGLVQTASVSVEGRSVSAQISGAAQVERFPISADVNFQRCDVSRPERALTPDARLRGISYFEDFGINPISSARTPQQYNSLLRFVCWMNRRKITGDYNSQIVAACMSMIIQALCDTNPWNDGIFTNVKATLRSIPPADAAIFARYTYSETVAQYLLPPYAFFALDLNVGFSIPSACLEPFPETTPSAC